MTAYTIYLGSDKSRWTDELLDLMHSLHYEAEQEFKTAYKEELEKLELSPETLTIDNYTQIFLAALSKEWYYTIAMYSESKKSLVVAGFTTKEHREYSNASQIGTAEELANHLGIYF